MSIENGIPIRNSPTRNVFVFDSSASGMMYCKTPYIITNSAPENGMVIRYFAAGMKDIFSIIIIKSCYLNILIVIKQHKMSLILGIIYIQYSSHLN